MAALSLPAASAERLRFPFKIDGVADPTSLPIYTSLDADSLRADDPAPSSWDVADWFDAYSASSHLLEGYDAGRYGLWVKVANSEETAIVFVGQVVLT